MSTLLLDMSHFHKRIDSDDYKTWLEHFLERAHTKGFEIMALAGEVGWSTVQGRNDALAYLESFPAYNESRPPLKRFDGLHLPHPQKQL